MRCHSISDNEVWFESPYDEGPILLGRESQLTMMAALQALAAVSVGQPYAENAKIMTKAIRIFGFLEKSGIADATDRSTFYGLYHHVAISSAMEEFESRQDRRENVHPKQESEVAGIQVRFRERHATLIPGSILLPANGNPHHVPDAWIQVAGEACPVEVKRSYFGDSAVRQLRRYMDFYGCKSGYAVAPKLSAQLQSNMIFVPLD